MMRLVAILQIFFTLISMMSVLLIPRYLYTPTDDLALNIALQLAIAGGVFLWLALLLRTWRQRWQATTPSPDDKLHPYQRPINHWLVAVGMGLLLIVIDANIWSPPDATHLSHHIQVMAFVVGVIITGWGLSGGGLRLPQRLHWRYWQHEHVLLALILLIGLGLRVYDLEYGVHRLVDEIHSIYAVNSLRYWGDQAILTQHGFITAFTWLFAYGQHLLTELIGPGFTALRLPSAIYGTVQIWAMYRLAKTMVDGRTGLMAALFLATLPPHIQFSRLGLNNIAEPTFALLAFAFLARGLRYRHQHDFAWAGVMLGLTHYFYEGGRLFYTPFTVLWLVWLALFMPRRHTVFYRPVLRHVAIFLLALLAVMLPVYTVWGVQNLPFTPRYNATYADYQGTVILSDKPVVNGINDIDYIDDIGQPVTALWQRIRPYVLALVVSPTIDGFYRADTGLILVALVPLVILGMAYGLWRIREPVGALVIWSCVGAVIGNAVMTTWVHAPRLVVILPMLALLMALGVRVAWLLLGDGKRLRWLMIPVISGFCLWQAAYFVGDYLPNYYQRQFYNEHDISQTPPVFARDMDDVLFRAVQLPSNTTVHLISPALIGQQGYAAVLEYYGRYDGLDLNMRYLYARDLSHDYLSDLDSERNQAFFIYPDDERSLDLLSAVFDLGEPQFSPYDIPDDKQFALYYVPADVNVSAIGAPS